MKAARLVLPLIVAVLALSACGSKTHTLPEGTQSLAKTTNGTPAVPQSSNVPNIFAAARGLTLSDADLDRYIDPSVTGDDRVLARTIMRTMPANQRGDFAYLSRSGHLMSNNPALLRYITVTQPAYLPAPATAIVSRTRITDSARHAMDYAAPCSGSPPNPPRDSNGNVDPHGPYVREVSQCGYTAGFSFVNVPCSYSSFAPGDGGWLYFELGGKSGSLTEGGLQYNNDLSIQPYVSSTVHGWLQPQMQNNSVHYTCGMTLILVHGATYDGSMTFTETGEVPINTSCTPQTNFCNGNTITPDQASWLFYQSPGDLSDANQNETDSVGVHTPCLECTISKVTSIGQPPSSCYDYCIDNSYFGVDANYDNIINWMQVAFGEWESNCYSGTSLCTFDYSPDPAFYYGGQQYYPEMYGQPEFAFSDFDPALGSTYGPYETYDGVSFGGCPGCATSSVRKPGVAGGPYQSKAPPPPCTADADGLCAILTDENTLEYCYKEVWDSLIQDYIERRYPYESNYVFAVYQSDTLRGLATKTIVKDTNGCAVTSTTWSPAEPRVTYNDPYLP